MTDDLLQIIAAKRELLARGETSRLAVNCSENMPSNQKDRFIEFLIKENEEKTLDCDAMYAVMEDLLAGKAEEKKAMEAELEEERKKFREELERMKRKNTQL